MKGSIGTATRFAGEKISSPYGRIDWDTSNKARHVLSRKEFIKNHHKKDDILSIKSVKEIMKHAAKHPHQISRPSARVVYYYWVSMAKAGQLRGLWKPTE